MIVLAVVHVVVDNAPIAERGPLGWNATTWVATAAITSAVAALATLALAFLSRRLADATKRLASSGDAERMQQETHHQQSLSPFCVVRDARSWVESGDALYISLKVQNIGSGPAVHVNLNLQPAKEGLKPAGVGLSQYVGAMLPGETTPEIRHGFSGWGGREPTEHFVVRLEFENVFGAWGITEWHVYQVLNSHILLQPADVRTKPTITPDK